MRSLLLRIEQLFFHPVDARGFGLMRIGWGVTMLCFWLAKWPDITRFYSNAGMLPTELEHLVIRQTLRFSIFDVVTSPSGVFALYLLLLAACITTIIGFLPRVSIITAGLLLFSFHERNYMPLGGGDSVLRLTAFILMIAPGIDAFSFKRLRKQWKEWHTHRKLLPAPTMPMWPVILLTWQLIVLYFTSVWDKFQGTMWFDGSAVSAALHHAHFARWPDIIMDIASIGALPIAWGTLIFEVLWLLLLMPDWMLRELPGLTRDRVRRLLMIGGVIFHMSIFVLMDVGSFSIALMAAYLGLLTASDFALFKQVFHAGKERRVLVLYDGRCGLCMRSIATLLTFDWLDRLHPVDFHSPERQKVAPDLSFEKLNKAMHIRLPNGKTYTGFKAMRRLGWVLPALRPLVPFLFLPGVSQVGEWAYKRIAQRRKRCTHEHCNA